MLCVEGQKSSFCNSTDNQTECEASVDTNEAKEVCDTSIRCLETNVRATEVSQQAMLKLLVSGLLCVHCGVLSWFLLSPRAHSQVCTLVTECPLASRNDPVPFLLEGTGQTRVHKMYTCVQ